MLFGYSVLWSFVRSIAISKANFSLFKQGLWGQKAKLQLWSSLEQFTVITNRCPLGLLMCSFELMEGFLLCWHMYPFNCGNFLMWKTEKNVKWKAKKRETLSRRSKKINTNHKISKCGYQNKIILNHRVTGSPFISLYRAHLSSFTGASSTS